MANPTKPTTTPPDGTTPSTATTTVAVELSPEFREALAAITTAIADLDTRLTALASTSIDVDRARAIEARVDELDTLTTALVADGANRGQVEIVAGATVQGHAPVPDPVYDPAPIEYAKGTFVGLGVESVSRDGKEFKVDPDTGKVTGRL